MPRGQKSKLRAHEKRRQAQDNEQGLGAQAAAEEEGEYPSSSPVSRGASPSSSAADSPENSPRGATASPAAAIPSASSGESAMSQAEGSLSLSGALYSSASLSKDPLTRKVNMLVQFMLHKYKTKEPITKAEMLKIINKKYKECFPEILRKVAERMELVFGIDLKEVDPSNHVYMLFDLLDLSSKDNLSEGKDFPKNGLLMTLLGRIFLSDNRTAEKDMWEFLNVLGLQPGRRHPIFGEPRKLLTQDFVELEYLEYQRVPHSDPPRFEFLWGPRAYSETTKMKVLEFWAKASNTAPSDYEAQFEEALRDEEERALARATARALSRAMSRRSSQR